MDWEDRRPPLLVGMDMRPVDAMKTEFDDWTDETLNGYVIMLETFVSSAMSGGPMNERYREKLAIARKEAELRLARRSGEREVEFHGEAVMREELESTYDHDERTTEPTDSNEPEDGE